MLFATSARRIAGRSRPRPASRLPFCCRPAPALADAGFEHWIASFRSTAAQERHFRARPTTAPSAASTDPDPEVLEKARYQPEFTAPVWDYFDNRVHEQLGRSRPRHGAEVQALARPDRGALRRRPLHPARHLVDGIELRRDPQERQGHAQRRALAGDACLCRQEARQIRPHAADRGAEDPADAATSTRAI